MYDKRVDVYAQTKAWADRPFSLKWAMTTLKNHIDERTAAIGVHPCTIGFCDNLDSHTTPEFLASRSLEKRIKNLDYL